MIGENIAVLDLGTNSFHLLIAKLEEHGFEELLKKKVFVQLAEFGLDHIPKEKFDLAIQVIEKFKDYLEEYDVKEFRIYGTAGLRSADNGQHFMDYVKENFDFDIQLISGDREAEPRS